MTRNQFQIFMACLFGCHELYCSCIYRQTFKVHLENLRPIAPTGFFLALGDNYGIYQNLHKVIIIFNMRNKSVFVHESALG